MGNTKTRKRRQKGGSLANQLPSVLGLVAAQGYKNVLSPGLLLKKNVQSNYLMGMQRETRLKEKKARYFRDMNAARNTSRLHFAIGKQDPAAVRFVLQEPGVQVDQRDAEGRTPLEHLLFDFKFLVEQPIQNHANVQRREIRIHKYHTLLQRLLSANARITPKSMEIIWRIPLGRVAELFEKFPIFAAKSYEFSQHIQTALRGLLREAMDDIQEAQEEANAYNSNGYGGFGIPQELIETYDKYEVALDYFQQFLRTYNPETGAYTFGYE